jgi:hypothetical protein
VVDLVEAVLEALVVEAQEVFQIDLELMEQQTLEAAAVLTVGKVALELCYSGTLTPFL